MKTLGKCIIYGAFVTWYRWKFGLMIRKLDPALRVHVVDIDNTLADTWPSLQQYVYHSESQRYSTLSVFIGMRRFILERIAAGEKVIFISARGYLRYRITLKWLLSCGIRPHQLVLVDSAVDKLLYLNDLLARSLRVVYIDDLSYDHEYGEMKLYEELIAAVKKLPLLYLGLREIELINSRYVFNYQDSKKDVPYLQDHHTDQLAALLAVLSARQ